MKMSTKGRYGIRLMLELAIHYGRGPASAELISKNQRISEKYIHVLITNLRNAGLVNAARGPNGGYALARQPSSITALDIITALEGRCEPVPCTLNANACEASEHCVARDLWKNVASAVDKTLTEFSLARLVAMHSQKQQATISYEI